MKKSLFLIVLIVIAVLAYFRQRIYVRDPLATVFRNEVQQNDVQVFQNYSNSVLLEKDDDPGAYRILVQDFDLTPAVPERLVCIRWLVCLTEDDRAPTIPVQSAGKGKYNPKTSLTSRELTFVDGNGDRVRVELR